MSHVKDITLLSTQAVSYIGMPAWKRLCALKLPFTCVSVWLYKLFLFGCLWLINLLTVWVSDDY